MSTFRDVIMKFRARGSSNPAYGEGASVDGLVHSAGGLLVAQDLPARAARVLQGESYQVITATAAAPVTAIPTTASLLELQNLDSSKHYVIDEAFVLVVAATAAIQAMGILLNVGLIAKAAIAQTLTIRCTKGGKAYGGSGAAAVGTTIAAAAGGVASNWLPYGPSPTPVNTTQVGQVMVARINGGIVLPPGGVSLGMSVISGAATATSVQLGLRWHEV